MNFKHKKLVVTIIVILLVFALVASFLSGIFIITASAAVSQSDVDALRGKLSDISSEKNSLQKELNKIAGEKKDAVQRKSELERRAEVNQREIDAAEQLISKLSGLVKEKTVELENAQAEEKGQYELLKKRIRAMYELGDMTFIEMLLSSETFSELQSRFDIITQITDYDRKTMENLVETRKQIQQTKESLEYDKSEQETLKAGLQKKKSELNNQLGEIKEIQSELNQNEQTIKAVYDEMEEEEAKVQAELREMLSKLAKNSKYVGGTMMWPLPSEYTTITSPFGYRIHPILKVRKLHTGTDISAPKGTKIFAANDGEVIVSGYSKAWGNYVVINHGGGTATLYAHMSQRLASVGDKVLKGDTIGLVGATGYASGNHLHFEIQKNGESVDPFQSEFKKVS